MNKNSILLLDPTFDPSLSLQLSLLVKIGIDSFTYAIADEQHNLLYAVYDEQECDSGDKKLVERLKTDTYLKLAYKKVVVAVHTQNQVCVPNELVTDKFIATQSAFFNDTAIQNIYVSKNMTFNFSTIYALPSSTENIINDRWLNNTKASANDGLLNLLESNVGNEMLINFTVKAFDLIYKKDETIVFQQSYQFDDLDELTYYILLVANQLAVETKDTKLMVCGIIHENDEKWNRLAAYFNEMKFAVATTKLNTGVLDDMPLHYYTSLLALQSCE